jgi:tRNA-2-methylthio-N6-dimethylallyladenosine synthase
MRRTYTREQYLDLVDRAYKIVPNLSLSTDIIAGFCGETEEEHLDTLSLIEQVRYDHAYLFIYSERPGTYAARKYTDDIPDAVKKRRLDEIITVHRRMATERNIAEIGTIQTLLVEGTSKRRQDQLFGRTDSNKVVIFDRHEYQAGQYVNVRITDASSATLMGEALGLTTLAEGTGKLVGV